MNHLSMQFKLSFAVKQKYRASHILFDYLQDIKLKYVRT